MKSETEMLPALNLTPLLCRKKVRAFLLEHAAKTRGQKFTRVSEETLRAVNANVRVMLLGIVHRAPSKGKTL